MGVLWEPELDETDRLVREKAIRLTRERFAPLAAELDRKARYPWEHIPALVEEGLAGIFVPTEYGGQGAGLLSTCVAIEEVAAGCASTSAILSVYALGAFPILLAGTEEQKHRHLHALARLGEATSFALTEYGAGSDAAAIATTARRTAEGWHIEGEKRFIGNGGASRYYVVFAKTDPLAGSRGVTAFILDKDEDPNVVIDHYEDKMGLRGALTSNLKIDTHIPPDRQLGEEGRGLRLALQTLNVGRVTVSAQAIGIGVAAFREASRRAAERHTFGKPIIENQGVSFSLADRATELSAARMMMHQSAKTYDSGGDISTLGAMTKLFATEAAHRSVDAAVQIFGGDGYCKPHAVERFYRDQRITEIYEGTSEIQRLVIARAISKEVSA